MLRNIAFTMIGLAALLCAGCGDDPGRGRLKVLLTDAPFPFDMVASAEITVDAVNVHVDAEDGDESGWVNLPGAGGVYDLLDLQNGVTADLASAELPVGRVDQVRLVISEGTIELTDGRSFNLKIPSGSSSGLKVFPRPPIQVVENLTTELLLDVDVSRSFTSIPASPIKVDEIREFHFHPVLRVANMTTTGSLSGHVYSNLDTPETEDDTPIDGAMIMATTSDDTTTTATNADGFYQILGLSAETWKVVASASGFAPDSLEVDVVAGNDAGGNDLRLTPDAP